jgi:hypothetical protein
MAGRKRKAEAAGDAGGVWLTSMQLGARRRLPQLEEVEKGIRGLAWCVEAVPPPATPSPH